VSWYYQNGELHRTDGPAAIFDNGHRAYWRRGERHRIDGPAVIYSDGSKEWYIFGNRLTHQSLLCSIRRRS
jgi:hypothetical protein